MNDPTDYQVDDLLRERATGHAYIVVRSGNGRVIGQKIRLRSDSTPIYFDFDTAAVHPKFAKLDAPTPQGAPDAERAALRELAISTIEDHGLLLANELKRGGRFDGGNLLALLEIFAERQAARAQPASPQWLPCAERLPDKGIFFLAFGPGLGNYVGGPEMDICKFDGNLWVEGGTELAFEEQRFTHWMPLPAPPQQPENSNG